MRVNSLAGGFICLGPRQPKEPGARAIGSLAFSFGRNFPAPVTGDLSPSLTATAAAGILYPFRYPSCRTLR
jgi:hypothetical protein